MQCAVEGSPPRNDVSSTPHANVPAHATSLANSSRSVGSTRVSTGGAALPRSSFTPTLWLQSRDSRDWRASATVSIMRLPSLAATIAAIAATTPAAQAPSARPCGAAEYRQFDFWIGEWDVFDRDGSKAGHNRVESIEGGCGVQENWTSIGGGT